jgi:TusA-related sulfurtransferase
MIKTLDVRGLEPPQPMVEILSALADLPPGDVLEVTHHREPVPLYAHLDEGGFEHSIEKLEEGRYRLRVWRRA